MSGKFLSPIKITSTGLSDSSLYLFLASFLTIFLWVFFKFPSMTYAAEPWAEAGTNYFYYATQVDFISNFSKPDAGYLPLFPRLISVVVVKIFGIQELFPVVTQLIALTFIAACAASLNASAFRMLFPNDWHRFLLSLALGLVPDYELYAFINFSYFAAIPCLLVVVLDKEKISMLRYALLLVFVMMAMCTKATFIVFGPVYGLLFLFFLYEKKRSEWWFYGMACLAVALQFTFTLLHSNKADKLSSGSSLEKVSEWGYTLWSLMTTVLFKWYPENIGIPGFNSGIFLSMLLVFVYLLWGVLKRKKRTSTIFILSCMGLILGSTALNILSRFVSTEGYTPGWSVFSRLDFMRWYFFPLISFFLLMAVLFQELIKKQWVLLAILLFMSLNFSVLSFNKLRDNFDHTSNWQAYKRVLKDPDYYLPINPHYKWAVKKRTHLADSVSPSDTVRAILVIKFPEQLKSMKLFLKEGELIPERLDSGKSPIAYFYFREKVPAGKPEFYDAAGTILHLPQGAIKWVVVD